MEFRGYKIFLNNTYPSIYMPEHQQADAQGRVFIHRLIMSEHLGRSLECDEIVHHKDEDKWNWEVSNLELTNHSEHGKHHHPTKKTKRRCEYCNKWFTPKYKHDERFCDPKCSQMAHRKFHIDRDVLKKLIWEKPTIHIAKEFGVSDKTIEKRCKLFGIKKPPRGHWAKIKAGVV